MSTKYPCCTHCFACDPGEWHLSPCQFEANCPGGVQMQDDGFLHLSITAPSDKSVILACGRVNQTATAYPEHATCPACRTAMYAAPELRYLVRPRPGGRRLPH